MSQTAATTLTEDRDENGRLTKNTTVGIGTRFLKGNTASLKYREEYCLMMLDYFQREEREVFYEEEYHKDGTLKKRTPKIVLAPNYPTFEKFATMIGVTARTLRDWASDGEDGKPKHPRFSLAYALAKDRQLAIAKSNGMTKQYDSNFAKFILINDHGLSDKTASDSTVTFTVELSDEIDEESN